MATQVSANSTAVSKPATFGIKSSLLLVVRFIAAFIVMLIAFVVSNALIGANMQLSPDEAAQSVPALLIVSLVNALVLAYLIARSHWRGIKLIAAVVIFHFGTQTFMTQIETLFFIGALKMPLDMVMRVIASGFLRAALFAPLAVMTFGKLTGTQSADDTHRWAIPHLEWIKRFAILAAVYVVVYFAFGYFVAFRWIEAQNYYAGTFANDLSLPLFQVVRGVMWAALGLLIVKMLNTKTWETGLAIGILFAVLTTSLLLFPNPYMPPIVRQAHFFEVSSSMLTYGVIAGWVWTRKTTQ